MSEATNQENENPSFENRFNIKCDIDSSKRAFINRVENLIVQNCFLNTTWLNRNIYTRTIKWRIANSFGEKYNSEYSFAYYHNNDFYRCLKALEIAYEALPRKSQKEKFNSTINWIINNSEIDLGIIWKDGVFIRSGAKQLDRVLIIENLQWLSQHEYNTVLTDFEKGLSDYLESINKPVKLSDVITDMYKSLESLVKIILKNNKDISANREKFIGTLKLSKYYSKMLGDYIEYANEYSRHGVQETTQKPQINRNEVESFIYMTGLFIRLAIQQVNSPS